MYKGEGGFGFFSSATFSQFLSSWGVLKDFLTLKADFFSFVQTDCVRIHFQNSNI
jgi:hypothetical protein